MSVIQKIDVGANPLILDPVLRTSVISVGKTTLLYNCSLTGKGGLEITRQPTFTLAALVQGERSTRSVSVPSQSPDLSSGTVFDKNGNAAPLQFPLSALPSFPILGALGQLYFEVDLAPNEEVAVANIVVQP